MRIQPGDTVVFETLEASAKQIVPGTPSEAVATLSFDPIHPLTGPVYVEGAEPGDALVVEIVSLVHKAWGWNAVIPGFGLLGGGFHRARICITTRSATIASSATDIRIPYEPFCGVMGVGPRESGRLTTIPPRENGGNIDIRHLTPGSVVQFPVLVPGALFSCGDCHAAQGDGEVNGTGIETPMTVTLRFDLHKGANIPELRFTTAAGAQTDRRGHRRLLRDDRARPRPLPQRAAGDPLHDRPSRRRTTRMTREQAYCLCGAAVDLKISEIVDAPNWIVSAYLPLGIFVYVAPMSDGGQSGTRLSAHRYQVTCNRHDGRQPIVSARLPSRRKMGSGCAGSPTGAMPTRMRY